ncbi:replicative DNA helicase [Pseudovibrio sp. SPO723]|uniref:replicative DNA helicase n=1 Tax=Nesiotobacter zosterae TaxID=392721 RepID=UPI0029C58847|nr:DnaB-like helicase C-terminal domain-containing protein [Pseudovibrio sp. SPO723]MDX5592554.1 DnaB-like helicase C-terminal domain-containing protein [Pseudovibrio sp. SPO723]
MQPDIVAERNALALMIAKPEAYFEVAEVMTVDHFTDATNREFFVGMEATAKEGLPYNAAGERVFDIQQVYANCPKQVEDEGGVDLFSKLVSLSVTGRKIDAGIMSLVRPLIDRKDAVDAAQAMQKAISDLQKGKPASEVVGATADKLKHLEGKSQLARIRVIGDVAEEVYTKLEAGPQKRGVGVNTGIDPVDRILGGDWVGGDLIGIGGAPASGKTAFLIQVGLRVAERGGTVQFESFEMQDVQLAQRLLSARAGVDSAAMKKADLEADELERVYLHTQKLKGVPFYIDCTPRTTVEQIYSRAMARKQRDGLSLLVVDSLKATGTNDRQLNSQLGARAGYVMKELKEIAKDLDVPVAVLLHPKTGLQLGPTQRIRMEDFYGGSNLQSDADTVAVIHRPGPQVERAQPEQEGTDDHAKWQELISNWPHERAQVWAEKVRVGGRAGGMIDVYFDGNKQEFSALQEGFSWT